MGGRRQLFLCCGLQGNKEGAREESGIVSVFLAIGLPLFIKPRQIQLACGLPPNLINLLSCEKLNSPCQYLISPAADKISSRYSMGFSFSLQLHHSHTGILTTVAWASYFPLIYDMK